MRTLLIDNYDSFTYNLFQLLAEVNGAEPIVVRNDEAGWEELARMQFDNVVISPGPGRPERARDFGVCADAIRRCEAPLLGVCLGHQGLAWAHGGGVVRAPEAMHGRVCTVEHAGAPLFAGIPARFRAVRYHSLCAGTPLPPDLAPIAMAEDGVVMAVAHRRRPQWGVQFHPESIATEHGGRLLANFRDLSRPARTRQAAGLPARHRRGTGAVVASEAKNLSTKAPISPTPPLELRTRRLGLAIDPEAAFVALYGDSDHAFWLDGALGKGSRFSFIGDSSGPLAATVTYDVEARQVTVERAGEAEVLSESVFDFLERERRRLRPRATELPFAFDCGFAGFFGYELKAECGGARAHRSELPDAAFVLADRMVAFDHSLGHTHLLCLADESRREEADAWLAATEARLGALAERPVEPMPRQAPGPIQPRPSRSRARYLEDIAECKLRLLEGESYEVCLTNTIAAEVDADPLDLFTGLRRVNPAPFSAYLRFGELSVLSSSPERFLRVDRERRVEARPIKGTSRRGATRDERARLAERLREDEKSRAENLMIADLLRNDLGAVCEVGSVEVPALMEVETHETVHHLVSTVRGRLRPGLAAIDCVRACFPPGSMTGAPKLRTMEILDRLEGRARGVYSGAIGFLGLSGGCDLSVAIRTIVVEGGRATIGAGGAIVLQSDPDEEYEEMLLKAAAPMRAIDPSGRPGAAFGAVCAPEVVEGARVGSGQA